MSNEEFDPYFPYDKDGFLLRKCKHCKIEFEIFPTKEERENHEKLVSESICWNFKLEHTKLRDCEPPQERYCPLCSLEAISDHFWLEEWN